MTRLFRWAALAAFLLPFSACDKLTEADDASETEPSVSVVLSNAVIHPLDAPDFTVATVIAKAPAKGMSLSVMILDASKNVVTESFTTDFDPRPSSSDSLFSTSDWKIATKIATPPGSYTLKVIVTDKKGHTATQTANFQVAPDADDSGPSGELGIEDWSAPDVVLTDNFSSPRGTLRFSGASVDLTVRIQTLSGTDVTDDFSLDYPREVTASPFDLSDIGVAGSRADPGDYEMILTVRTVGGKELTERGQFAVESGSEMEDDFAMEGPVTLGAQSNSNPSFLQVQGGTPTSWSSGSKPVEKIDLVLGVDATGTLSLMSPNQANDDGFTLSSWATLNTTEIVGIGTEMPSSRASVIELLDDGGYGGTSEKVDLLEDYYYGVRLVTGQVVVVHVGEVTGSDRNAEAELTVYF